MLVLLNPAQVSLMIYAANPSGTSKLDVATATVRVYHIVSGSEVDDLAVTALGQIGSTNKWRYIWEPVSLAAGEYTVEYILVDDEAETITLAEELTVKDIATQTTLVLTQTDLTLVKQVQVGRWQLVNNQMIFYDSDNTTPILTFDCVDDSATPSMSNVFQRTPV